MSALPSPQQDDYLRARVGKHPKYAGVLLRQQQVKALTEALASRSGPDTEFAVDRIRELSGGRPVGHWDSASEVIGVGGGGRGFKA